jgi:hypothetical protein
MTTILTPDWNALRPGFARRGFIVALGGLLLGGATGCAVVRPGEQRLVAKPNMTFSEAAAFSYHSSRLFPQMATGFAASGGSQNSGCTSCR